MEDNMEASEFHKRIRESLTNTPADVLRKKIEAAGGFVKHKSDFDIWFAENVLGRARQKNITEYVEYSVTPGSCDLFKDVEQVKVSIQSMGEQALIPSGGDYTQTFVEDPLGYRKAA